MNDWVRLSNWSPSGPKWRVLKDQSPFAPRQMWWVMTPHNVPFARFNTWAEAMGSALLMAHRDYA